MSLDASFPPAGPGLSSVPPSLCYKPPETTSQVPLAHTKLHKAPFVPLATSHLQITPFRSQPEVCPLAPPLPGTGAAYLLGTAR